jgi:UDP-glucose 4-epimerase
MINNYKIGILGSAGFIGRNFIKLLKKKKINYISINRKSIKKISILKNINYIFHFANQNNEVKANLNPIKDLKNNLFTTIDLLKKISEENNSIILIYISTASLYKTSKKAVNENSNIKLLSIYNLHKFFNEEYIKIFFEKHKIRFIILRTSNVYGFNSKNNRGYLLNLIKKIINNNKITFYNSGKQLRDYIYIDDYVNALYKITTKKNVTPGIFNLSYGKSYSYLDLFKKIKKILKVKFKKHSISNYNLIKNNNKLDNRFYVSNSDYFKKKFNWKPSYSIENGIESIINKILSKEL